MKTGLRQDDGRDEREDKLEVLTAVVFSLSHLAESQHTRTSRIQSGEAEQI